MANSGETSKRMAKSAARFLALSDDERCQWIESKVNWKTVASWAASLVSQAPNRVELQAEIRRMRRAKK